MFPGKHGKFRNWRMNDALKACVFYLAEFLIERPFLVGRWILKQRPACSDVMKSWSGHSGPEKGPVGCKVLRLSSNNVAELQSCTGNVFKTRELRFETSQSGFLSTKRRSGNRCNADPTAMVDSARESAAPTQK